MDVIRIKEKTLELDRHGFLTDPDAWNRDVANYLAEVEGIHMTEQHWVVVNFLRDYYQQHKATPKISTLVRELGDKLGADKAKTRYLDQLYPCGADLQACKIAGLPNSAGRA